MSTIAGKKVALGVCGGIAAYKVVEVARRLTQAGAKVQVVMTRSATKFVGPLSFSALTGNAVRTELFPEVVSTEIVHTDLGRTSDLVLIAPATANTIAKCAQGISDDLLPALVLSSACPVIMAPAMHPEMWCDAATKSNVDTLISNGVLFVGPVSGALAGPDEGVGRLASTEEILAVVEEQLVQRTMMEGVSVVVTAGGTREPIDAVRFIGNRSSGKMGHALAAEAVRRGAKVTLITAAAHLPGPAGANVVEVDTAAAMKDALDEAIGSAQVLMMAAAVADFRPTNSLTEEKIKKQSGLPTIELSPTQDILADIGLRRAQGSLPALKVLAGFCAETGDLEVEAKRKLEAKHLDFIVANPVSEAGIGFDSDTNRALVVGKDGRVESLPMAPKRVIARQVVERVAARFG